MFQFNMSHLGGRFGECGDNGTYQSYYGLKYTQQVRVRLVTVTLCKMGHTHISGLYALRTCHGCTTSHARVSGVHTHLSGSHGGAHLRLRTSGSLRELQRR